MKRRLPLIRIVPLAALATLLSAGCIHTKSEIKPIEIKPIHITMDINLKIDRELDDFFGDIDSAPNAPAQKPQTEKPQEAN